MRTQERIRNELENMMEQISDGVRRGKYTWSEIQTAVVEKARTAARTTDDFVHERPWEMIGAAAVVGIVIGLLLRGRE